MTKTQPIAELDTFFLQKWCGKPWLNFPLFGIINSLELIAKGERITNWHLYIRYNLTVTVLYIIN